MNNGVCDLINNIPACNYDSLDCCQEGENCPLQGLCNFDLLRNGKCDLVANTSSCLYDLGACLTQQTNNQENVSLVNENTAYFKLSMLCTESLYNDSICDFENFLPACNFDEGDCDNGEGKLLIKILLQPCPFRGLKLFWAGPNFLCQTKSLFTYCGSHKHSVPVKKMICIQ